MGVSVKIGSVGTTSPNKTTGVLNSLMISVAVSRGVGVVVRVGVRVVVLVGALVGVELGAGVLVAALFGKRSIAEQACNRNIAIVIRITLRIKTSCDEDCSHYTAHMLAFRLDNR